ncbi:MAG: FHA domain-containing protein [bacterium]|nr:FHA domain-containing protein [bacterium]
MSLTGSVKCHQMTTEGKSHPGRRYCLRGQLNEARRRFVLSEGENCIGRTEANSLVIPVPQVSRHHARLELGPQRMELSDLGSHNGTFVNGVRIKHAAVEPGDLLGFGPVELRLDELDAGDVDLAVVLPAASRTAQPLFSSDEDTSMHVAPSLSGLPGQKSRELVFPDGYVAGRSHAMRRLYKQMRPLLGARMPVLVEGETGTGKESVAQTLHLSSPRHAAPLVAINCAAIPSDLLEAEFFGIGEGVATGVRKRSGKFLDAHGGTMLLDELAEMPLQLQAKLLRALDRGKIEPVGATAAPVDVWVIAATNTHLQERVEQGLFRRDLYHRVAGYVLPVPALCERREDIPRLVVHFLKEAAAEDDKALAGVTHRAMGMLSSYHWPGNVRELELEVRRLAYACTPGEAIESTMLSESLQNAEFAEPCVQEEESLRLAGQVRNTERRAILKALEHAGGSQRLAAQLLDISRTTLSRKLRKLDILPRHQPPPGP